MDVVDEGGADGADSEAEWDAGNEPARANPFTGHVGWDLEDNVGDVEDGENPVVVISFQVEILLETSEFGIACNKTLWDLNVGNLSKIWLTDIGTINKTEKIEEGDGGNNIQIDLHPKSGFGTWVELHKRMAVPKDSSKRLAVE